MLEQGLIGLVCVSGRLALTPRASFVVQSVLLRLGLESLGKGGHGLVERSREVDVVTVGEGHHAPQAVGELVGECLVEVFAGSYAT